MNFTVVFPVPELDGSERPWTVIFTVRPGRPGKYSGPPEECYPEEVPEVDIVQAISQGVWLDENTFIKRLNDSGVDFETFYDAAVAKFEAETAAYEDLGEPSQEDY